ncbi:hypothetical protein DUNSADRAFT_12620 [Dunaliella salina]|uniref:Uncharacterized protein n=1 Tax=Dunaliella salina TaxID=3046 RepID=A0ABQ7GAW5_DUNSA|nr:hypothetical protein DUNSADRAFT_12620 [Dunaliella salina]|eukprot:KAF5831750.1 hypothetical protein DUNSADRAFT_12620 [Dunaliella salina]
MGEGNWSPIARVLNEATGKDDMHGRIGKQCRERWNHHLKPGINKEAWTPHEEALIVQAHMVLGNRWSEIAKSIAGRSENAVKNHWNATLRRRDVLDAEPGPLKIYMLQNNITGSQKGSSGILQCSKKTGGKGSKGGSKTAGPGTPRKRAAQRRDEEEDFSDGGSTTPDEDAASGSSVRAGPVQGAEGCSSMLLDRCPGLSLHMQGLVGGGLPWGGQHLNWTQNLPFGGLGFNGFHGAFQGITPPPLLSPFLSLPPFQNHHATMLSSSRSRPSSHLTPQPRHAPLRPPPGTTQAFGSVDAKGSLKGEMDPDAAPVWPGLPALSRPAGVAAVGAAAGSTTGAAMHTSQGSNAACLEQHSAQLLPRLPRLQSCSHAHLYLMQQQQQQYLHQAVPLPAAFLDAPCSLPDARPLPSLSSSMHPGSQPVCTGGTSSISPRAMAHGQQALPVPRQSAVGKQPFKQCRSDAGPLCTLPPHPPASSASLGDEGTGNRGGAPWREAGEESEEDVSQALLPQLRQVRMVG